jgi:DNA replication protein DnaC
MCHNPCGFLPDLHDERIPFKEGIVLCGNPGTGKTHLATALGLKACEKGLRVRFYTAAGLVNDLLEAHKTMCSQNWYSNLTNCIC